MLLKIYRSNKGCFTVKGIVGWSFIENEFLLSGTANRADIVSRQIVERDAWFNTSRRIPLFRIINVSAYNTLVFFHCMNYCVFIFLTTSITFPSTHFITATTVSYTHLRAHETRHDIVCRLLLE